jgi:hypothetical protein
LPVVPDTFQELDALPTAELRHRAFRLARERHDLKFFWDLMRMIPAADEAEGRPDKLATEVEGIRTWLDGFLTPEHELLEAMRPVFIDYLSNHSK